MALIAVIGSILAGDTAGVAGLAGKDVGVSTIRAHSHACGVIVAIRQQVRRSTLQAIRSRAQLAVGRAVVGGLIDAKPIRKRKVGVALSARGGGIAGSTSRQTFLAPSTG